MNINEFEELIYRSYEGRHRTDLWLACALQVEASELAEHIMKFEGYKKLYDRESIESEAGDILNFLTAILQSHNIKLEDVMMNNSKKLKDRGWV